MSLLIRENDNTYPRSEKEQDTYYSRVNSKKVDLKMRKTANFIGTLTLTFTDNEHGSLYYRIILTNKGHSLNANKGNYNTRMKLIVNACRS